jgi:hypothetical protein
MPLSGIETRLLGAQPIAQSLHQLSYPDSLLSNRIVYLFYMHLWVVVTINVTWGCIAQFYLEMDWTIRNGLFCK